MEAVTTYLRELRIRKNISQATLADAMGISLRQTNRWENGDSEGLKAEAFVRAVAFLDASRQHVERLLLDREATEDDARRFAEEYFTAEDMELARGVSSAQVQYAGRLLDGLSDRELLSELIRRQEQGRAPRGGGSGRRRAGWRPWRREQSSETTAEESHSPQGSE